MVKIKVPATSANVGGGFDCMGIAVNLYNEIVVRENDKFEIVTDIDIPNTPANLVYRSFIRALQFAAQKQLQVIPQILQTYLDNPDSPLPIYIEQINNIPKTSGLGSSAACIVGGILAANVMLGNVLDEQEIACLCTKIEGHPDNVLPCLFGGLVAAVIGKNDEVHYIKRPINKRIKLCLFTPNFQLETKQSRRVLPQSYPIGDFVYSMSRAVLTFSAFADGDTDMLKEVVGDKIHEPYRSALIPDYDNIISLCKSYGGIATYLSGAGPSIACIIDDRFSIAELYEKISYLPNNWKIHECDVDNKGAVIEIL